MKLFCTVLMVITAFVGLYLYEEQRLNDAEQIGAILATRDAKLDILNSPNLDDRTATLCSREIRYRPSRYTSK